MLTPRKVPFPSTFFQCRLKSLKLCLDKGDHYIGGYIYVGHLQKFNDNPKRHKDGYLNIGHMDEEEFAQIVKEVTKHYI